jgi:hypothetical protein
LGDDSKRLLIAMNSGTLQPYSKAESSETILKDVPQNIKVANGLTSVEYSLFFR